MKYHCINMSSNNKNNETLDLLRREIKDTQARCMHACQVVENAPLDAVNISPEQTKEKTLCYVEGLQTEIQNSETPIISDNNLLTSQFLQEIQTKITQIKELIAFKNASINNLDTEIDRLTTLINVSKEARSRSETNRREVRPENIQKAKERFQMMKNELHELMQSLFPNNNDVIMDILGQLMAAHLDGASDSYVTVTCDMYESIMLLKDMKIVTVNPYNNLEVKLAY